MTTRALLSPRQTGRSSRRLGSLELLITTGARNAAIDAQACADLDIMYCGTGGRVQSTAELTWGLILGCARHLPTEVGNVSNGASDSVP